MKKILLLLMLGANFESALAYRVISRTVERCGSPNFWGKEQCAKTSKVLGGVELPDGSTLNGWIIECSGAASNSCPKHLPIGDLPDENDVTWSNYLFDYYDNQIASGNLTGSHTITVLLLNGQYAYYTITWQYIDNNGEVSGFINIDRN